MEPEAFVDGIMTGLLIMILAFTILIYFKL